MDTSFTYITTFKYLPLIKKNPGELVVNIVRTANVNSPIFRDCLALPPVQRFGRQQLRKPP